MQEPFQNDSESQANGQASAPSRFVRWLLRVLALAGLGLSVYLAYLSFKAGAVGCGADGCDEVIHTSWGKVLNVPIGIPAAAMYLAALLATLWLTPNTTLAKLHGAWSVLVIVAIVAIGGAVWFTWLQRYEIGAFCLFCMATHAVGFGFAAVVFAAGPLPWSGRTRSGNDHALRLGWPESLVLLSVGVLGVTSMVMLQRFFPSDTLVVERGNAGNAIADANLKPGQILLNVPSGAIVFEPAEYPMIGTAQAEHTLLVLFDFTCPHCRLMHGQMQRTVARYDNKLAFVLLPMPLDGSCNPIITHTEPRHENGCEYARLSIATWLAKPAAYDQLVSYMMEGDAPPTVKAAREKAAELVGGDELANALADEEVGKQLERNIKLYEITRGGPLPKVIGDSLLIFGRPSTEQEFFELLETELNLQPIDSDDSAVRESSVRNSAQSHRLKPAA